MRARAGKQRGAALLMVLLLVAVMLVLSVGLIEGLRYNSQRLLNQRLVEQAFWYALGGERIAAFALADIADEPVVSLQQNWAREDILFPVDGGSIGGSIVDQQACFNVKNLYQPPQTDGQAVNPEPPPAVRVFSGLLQNLEIDAGRADFIIDRLRDWIDEDFSPEGIYGAEDLRYTDAEYPYLPANQPLDNLSEMSLFAEFEEGERDKLQSQLCALPSLQSTINVNTLRDAQAPLLAAALGNVISVADARSLIASRPAAGWPDLANFVSALAQLSAEPPPSGLLQGLSVDSHYFQGYAEVYYEQRQLRLITRFVLQSGRAVAYAREYGEIF